MQKQNLVTPINLVNYLVPHLKNKIQRSSLNENLHSWLSSKFQGILVYNKDNDQVESSVDGNQSHIKNSLTIQKQFRIKFPLHDLLYNVPSQLYETTILYVMEKKLFWFFKPQLDLEEENLKLHKQLEISLNLKLKGLYKTFEYNTHSVKRDFKQRKNHNLNHQNSTLSVSNYPLRKKVDFDFQYNLLLMFLVSLVSAFFQTLFTELLIENSFKAEIYIILNHAFLDFEVSSNVFEIMRKKFTFQPKGKDSHSMDSSKIQNSTSSKRRKESEGSGQPSRRDPFLQNNLQMSLSIGKAIAQKNVNFSRTQISTPEAKEQAKSPISANRINSAAGVAVSSETTRHQISKKSIFLKQLSSIQQQTAVSTPTSKQKLSKLISKKSISRKHPNFSRFNSLLRQFSIPMITQQQSTDRYIQPPSQQSFQSTIKKFLHVDSLPPIIKKRMNINQYQKLNELGHLEDIKRQVQSLDVSSKKNHMKSNDLSLAMNTFISLSSGKEQEKKRHNHHLTQVISNKIVDDGIDVPEIEQQKRISQFTIGNEHQKQDYQFKRLPVKASNLKLPYQKSAHIYQFTDPFSSKDSSYINNDPSNIQHLLLTKKSQIRQTIQQEDKQKQRNLQDKKKKTPNEWQDYLNLLKKRQSNQNIATFNKKDHNIQSQNKKTLNRKTYHRNKELDKTHFITTQQQLLLGNSSKTISTNYARKTSKLLPRQSIIHKKPIQSLDASYSDLESQVQQTHCKDSLKCNNVEVVQMPFQNYKDKDTMRYSSLQGQVNVKRSWLGESQQKYNSFELRKRFKQFESNCKVRDQKIQYSMFKVNRFKEFKH